jgi:hypothetical protein
MDMNFFWAYCSASQGLSTSYTEGGSMTSSSHRRVRPDRFPYFIASPIVVTAAGLCLMALPILPAYGWL